ncbi:unnamed protein product [Phytomonas sp. Hart1]|nr:unnamed protein product [Phytomonas sp. Hart1]|eukprot:CCW68676.1 unnamed protein product [Phytomonas sp. isolate Hart1]
MLQSPIATSRMFSSKCSQNKSDNLDKKEGKNSLEKKTLRAPRVFKGKDDDAHVVINSKDQNLKPHLIQTTSNNGILPNHKPLTGMENGVQPVMTSTSRVMNPPPTKKNEPNNDLTLANVQTLTRSLKGSHYLENCNTDILDTPLSKQNKMIHQKIFETVDRTVIEDTACISYPLHTFEAIPDSFVRSFRAHRQLQICRSIKEKYNMIKMIKYLEEIMRLEILGQVFYFRVELEPLAADPSPNGARQGARRRLQAEVFGRLKHLLTEFAVNFLEVREGEVACDVSHYTSFARIVKACQTNVAQFSRDVHCVLKSTPLDPNGVVGETPKESILPLSIEEVAKEVGVRINKEIIHPLLSRYKGKGEKEEDARAVRVFFGIGPTPVLAKIACDAEIATWRRQHPTHGESPPPRDPQSQGHPKKWIRRTRSWCAFAPCILILKPSKTVRNLWRIFAWRRSRLLHPPSCGFYLRSTASKRVGISLKNAMNFTSASARKPSNFATVRLSVGCDSPRRSR